jgi:hypothetical protein
MEDEQTDGRTEEEIGLEKVPGLLIIYYTGEA